MFTERVAIFGAARSGRAAKELALQNGFEVALFDQAGRRLYRIYEKAIEDSFRPEPGLVPSTHGASWSRFREENSIGGRLCLGFWPGKIAE